MNHNISAAGGPELWGTPLSLGSTDVWTATSQAASEGEGDQQVLFPRLMCDFPLNLPLPLSMILLPSSLTGCIGFDSEL